MPVLVEARVQLFNSITYTRVNLNPKFKKIERKKVVRRFLTYFKFYIFFEFFTKSVLQIVLRGRETTIKKYQELSEKSAKNMIFSNFQKIEKKVVRRLLTYLKFHNFFEFFKKSVLETLLRGHEATGKKYQELSEKSAKNMIFSNFQKIEKKIC